MNYQNELENRIAAMQQPEKLLLHSCCAPCSSYVLEYLSRFFVITVFYYNPNITEEKEYRMRAEEQEKLIININESRSGCYPITFLEGVYEPNCFFEKIKGMELELEGGIRCTQCFLLRLKETARRAKEDGYDCFTTTLTISPLKDARRLNEIGQSVGAEYGISYLTSDFKKKNGYKRSIELSKEFELYRQDYCGCIYSKMQRERENIERQGAEECKMKKILDMISEEMQSAFEKAGYTKELGKVSLSNRPDLCEFQCNGAMAGAKQYKKPPLAIAQEVAEIAENSAIFSEVCAVAPGFLNMKLKEQFLVEFLMEMIEDPKFGMEEAKNPKTIIIDYGGPNVAKPLHVGHLRSAIIGESVKRIAKYLGHRVIGDIHLGDWGLQMGLIITEFQKRNPDSVYFDENYKGEYPKEAPFTISELEEIYPTASAKSKEDSKYKEEAMQATFKLQNGETGYRALWKHILAVSVTDLKKNYANLNVDFELWKGESDVHDRIPSMVSYMQEGGYAYISEGALVVDVKEESDTKEIPPCMILKSDGASLYNTTDLATIMERMQEIKPDEMIYVVDKRQELYFDQVFRCAKKTKLVSNNTRLFFLGFGTMNGKDGKPFKTREGGVMRLENLISDINRQMYDKIKDNREDMSEEEARNIAKTVALSAVKYGDLSNQASKDYIFDIERFTSFEGDTGPYILYTIVRIKSILAKYREQRGKETEEETCSAKAADLCAASSESEKALMLELAKFNMMMEIAYQEIAPHKVCAYIYDLANAFNKFYHETKILTEEDATKKTGWIALLGLTKSILEACIEVLGFEAPERM